MCADLQEWGLRYSDWPWLPALCVAPIEASAGDRAGAWFISGILAPVTKQKLFSWQLQDQVFTLSDCTPICAWFQVTEKPYWLPIPIGLPTYLWSGKKPSLCKPLPMSQGWVNKDISIFSASIPLLTHSMQHLFLIKFYFHFFALVI